MESIRPIHKQSDLHDSGIIFLSNELNLLKIHKMYNEAHPSNKVSYKEYYFNKKFNIYTIAHK